MPATATANVASRMRRRTRLSSSKRKPTLEQWRCTGGRGGVVTELAPQPRQWTSRVLVDPNQCSSHTRSMMCSRVTTAPACRTSTARRSNSFTVNSSPLRLARRGGGRFDPHVARGEQPSPGAALSANSYEQLAQTERFVHVVVRTGVEPDDGVKLLAAGGEDQDGEVAIRPPASRHTVMPSVSGKPRSRITRSKTMARALSTPGSGPGPWASWPSRRRAGRGARRSAHRPQRRGPGTSPPRVSAHALRTKPRRPGRRSSRRRRQWPGCGGRRR